MTIQTASDLVEKLGEWIEWYDEQLLTEMSLDNKVKMLQKTVGSMFRLNVQLCLLMAEKFERHKELSDLIIIPGRNDF